MKHVYEFVVLRSPNVTLETDTRMLPVLEMSLTALLSEQAHHESEAMRKLLIEESVQQVFGADVFIDRIRYTGVRP